MPRSARTSLALLSASVTLLGCAPESDSDLPPDVVLVVLDAAAAQRSSLYGYARETTPEIDALARDSIVWERAYAQAPQTVGSIASLLTGRHPRDVWDDGVLAGETVAERLQQAGYRTLGFTENPWLAPERGFDRGFDLYRLPPTGFTKAGSSVETVAAAFEALDDSGDVPVFLYLHLLPPHAPYDAPPPHAGRFAKPVPRGPLRGFLAIVLGFPPRPDHREDFVQVMRGEAKLSAEQLELVSARYDENLLWADSLVGSLVSGLRDRSRFDRALFIVTADHGEAFGEHGHFGHSSSLYDEQIRVPLVLRLPDAARERLVESAGRRAEAVALADLRDTIYDVAGVGGGDRSLLAAKTEPREPPRSFLGSSEQAVVVGSLKLVARRGQPPMLFDLARDPGERRDLAAERPGEVERLLAEVLPWRDDASQPGLGDVDPETRARLERLGYLE